MFKLQIEKSNVLHTKFGRARRSKDGYYIITSGKNQNRALHRLIWEDYYKRKIPKTYIIHHKNFDKTSNCILNLELMTVKQHHTIHHKGKKLKTMKDRPRYVRKYKKQRNKRYGSRKDKEMLDRLWKLKGF